MFGFCTKHVRFCWVLQVANATEAEVTWSAAGDSEKRDNSRPAAEVTGLSGLGKYKTGPVGLEPGAVLYAFHM